LSGYIEPLADQMSSQKDLQELTDLVKSKEEQFEEASFAVKQALNTVELNNQWKRNNYKTLVSRFDLLRAKFDDEDDEEFVI
jgi:hypothetical protein